LLHGQSWGGNVAAKAAELYALDIDGRPNYDGVLVTNGVLTGGTRAYGFRADLRAVYQAICRNHPKPDEPQYPPWQGLPAGSTMDRDELRRRVDDCTGVETAPAKRSARQAARLRDILAVTGVEEKQLVAHLAWGTFHFRDLVQKRLGGRNPFDNRATVYRGSGDDTALNAAVERFDADPAAVAALAYDADLSGQIVLPTLTIHARHDPVVSSRADATYAGIVAAAGRSALLAQALTDESDHSRMRDATYLAALQSLEAWLDGGPRPDPASLQATCLRVAKPASECRFLPAP
jgi:alpha-beta hydrolase superfamily lysophospholipase